MVVTTLLPKAELIRINETCRAHKIAFLLAANHGVTCTIFSDFGPAHEISDATGEPTRTLAVANLEVLETKPKLLEISGLKEGDKVVIVTVAQAEHGLDDGDVVTLEDMRGDLEKFNGKQLKVKRVAIQSPVSITHHLFSKFGHLFFFLTSLRLFPTAIICYPFAQLDRC